MEPQDTPLASQAFHLGEWLVEPSLNRVHLHDREVHLRPKVMDVLVALAARGPEAVVSKEDLVDRVWPDEAVPDSVLFRAVFEIREALGDESRHPQVLATIPRGGYKLLLPVTAASAPAGATPCPAQLRSAPSAPVATGVWPAARRALLAGFLALNAMMACLQVGDSSPLGWVQNAERREGLLVLPFAERGSPADPYLVAGVADELAVRLAAQGRFRVVAPDREVSPTSLTSTAAEIGRRQGVGHVLSGQVEWSSDPTPELHVEARLISVLTGEVVWRAACSFQRGHPLVMQGAIAAALADQLEASASLRAAANGGEGLPAPLA